MEKTNAAQKSPFWGAGPQEKQDISDIQQLGNYKKFYQGEGFFHGIPLLGGS